MAGLLDLIQNTSLSNSDGFTVKNRFGQSVSPLDTFTGAMSGLGNILGGAARGSITAALGVPGDINQAIVNNVGSLLPNAPALPTTAQWQQLLPYQPTSAEGQTAQKLGEFMPVTPSAAGKILTAGKDMPMGLSIVNETHPTWDKMMGDAAKMMEADGKTAEEIHKITGTYKNAAGQWEQMVPESEFVPGVNRGEEMIVHHNLSAEKLKRAEKLGGMPVPSLAVSKVSDPLQNFGDITLIGGKEMAVPSKGNPVYGFDAYTKRAPTIDYSFDTKSKSKLNDYLSDVISEHPRGEYRFQKLVDEYRDRDYSPLLRAKFLKETDQLPKAKDFSHDYEYENKINELVHQNKNDYENWLNKFDTKLENEGISPKERIFKGYTYSGNRRYAEANLANIVKEMKGNAGEEGWNYGVGNIRAVATPKFKKFDDLIKNRSQLVPQKDFEAIKNSTNDAYSNLIDRLNKIDSKYDASDALMESAQTKSLSNLDRIYKEVPPELKADIGMFIKNIKNMPTEYFEAKPQRAVGLNEFKGAIIPTDASQEVRNILQKNNIQQIYEYATPEERKGLFRKFGPEMFAGLPLTSIGNKKEKK